MKYRVDIIIDVPDDYNMIDIEDAVVEALPSGFLELYEFIDIVEI